MKYFPAERQSTRNGKRGVLLAETLSTPGIQRTTPIIGWESLILEGGYKRLRATHFVGPSDVNDSGLVKNAP